MQVSIVRDFEIEYSNLTKSQYNSLEKTLIKEGFKIQRTGHVIPSELLVDDFRQQLYYANVVGFIKWEGLKFLGIGKGYFFIENIDDVHLKKYTSQLKNICDMIE